MVSQINPPQIAVVVPGILAGLVALSSQGASLPGPTGKKLIEYGWDVPTPAQMQSEIATMEKRPFDGLIFRLNGGHNAFATNRLEAGKFTEDETFLHGLQFTKFKENFVLVWGSPPKGFDWFDDAQWDVIEANAKLLVGVALAGKIRGICFDPEPYDFSLWDYSKQPQVKAHTFSEYRAMVRKRGAGLMRAFEAKMPGATILTFFHVSLNDRLAGLPESERVEKLSREGWGTHAGLLRWHARGRNSRRTLYRRQRERLLLHVARAVFPRLPCHPTAGRQSWCHRS
jgi:hypothetical protein